MIATQVKQAAPPPEDADLIPTINAARMFGVRTITITRWINSGELVGFKPGRYYRVSLRSVLAKLERDRIKPIVPEQRPMRGRVAAHHRKGA